MGTISLRLEEADYELIQKYISANNLKLSTFVRDAIMEKLEDELEIDEAKILAAYKKSLKEPSFDHTEVWAKLGI